MSYITEAEKDNLLKDVFNYSEPIDFDEIVRTLYDNKVFAAKVIELYLKERKKTQPLNEEELNSYIWDQLRLADEDKDEKAIENAFTYYKNFNERNPLMMREEFNEWHGIRD